MRQDLAFASIRQGDLSAAEGWELLSPIVTKADLATAERLCDALRTWTWKALDRRRRDNGLREWLDVMNKVEAFLGDRFAILAAKVEALAELLHESLAVAALAKPDAMVRRKHVAPILHLLENHESVWLERAVLMHEAGLRPANTTRLMSELVDIGWVEQQIHGREAAYRLSAEGLVYARLQKADVTGVTESRAGEGKEWKAMFAKIQAVLGSHDFALKPPGQKVRGSSSDGRLKVWELESADLSAVTDEIWDTEIDDAYADFKLPAPIPVYATVGC